MAKKKTSKHKTRNPVSNGKAKNFYNIGIPLLLIGFIVIPVLYALTKQALNQSPVKNQEELDSMLVEGGIRITPPLPINGNGLKLHNGALLANNFFNGRWTLVSFGYLSCPDVCPVTMGIIQKTFNSLDSHNPPFNNLNILYVTVDPERDTAEVMSNYVNHFGPQYWGAVGSKVATTELASQLGAIIGEKYWIDNEFYSIPHSNELTLIAPNGKFVASLSPPHQPQKVKQFLIEAMR